MIALMDVDRSGKLGFDEFKKLWIDIKDWKVVFFDFALYSLHYFLNK